MTANLKEVLIAYVWGCCMRRGAIKATNMDCRGSVVRGTLKVSDRFVVHMMTCLFVLNLPLEVLHLV